MDNKCVEYWKDYETNDILLETCNKIQKLNEEYYKNIHAYLNMIFVSTSRSIFKWKKC